METMPWTKSECFAWNDGRRIVDLYELSKQLHCKQCSSLLDLRRTEREARYGLSSILYIHCNCGVLNDVHTGRIQQGGGDQSSQRPMYEINIKASINLLMYGAGASRVLSFLALLDIPVPPPDDPSLIVPVSDSTDTPTASTDIPVSNANATTSSSTTASSTPKQPSEGQTKKASFQKTLSSSARGDTTSSSVPDPACHVNNEQEESLQVADTETEEVNDSQTTDGGQNGDEDEQGEKDDEDGDGGDEDDDDEYVPSTRLKLRLKTRTPSPSKSKKPSLRGPKSARAKKAAKSVSEKKVKKLQVKVKKVAKKTSKAEEKETSKAREEDSSSKDFENTMDWSSTESEQGNSDASWHEQNEEDEDYNVPEETPTKRKRGRPKGATDKAKRAKKSSTPKEKKEGNNKKAKGEGEEEKEVPRCASCDKDFNSIKGYNVHMKRVHNQDMKARPRMRRKQDGSGEMESEWETVKEEAVTDSLYLCPVCSLLFSQAKCLSVHLKKVHQTEKANVDEYAVSMEGSALRLKRVWKTLQRYSYKCLKCDKVIHHRSTFGQHIRVNVNRKEVSCEATDPDSPGLNFYQRELFLTPGRRKILCHTCGAAFTEKSTFLNHVEESHGEVLREKYRCEFCDYSANAPRFLRLHYERKHPSTPRSRSHVCEVCGKAFFDKIVLDEHVNYVHLKQKEFRCSLCPKVFYRPQSFHKHKRNHAGKRPHVCAKCGQSFVFPYNLKIHERLHTGEKPHKCPQCDAAFTQKNGLDLHMKKHEKREGISLKPGAGNSVVSRKKTPPVQQDDTVTMPGIANLSTPVPLQPVPMMPGMSEVVATVFTDPSSYPPSAASEYQYLPSIQ